MKIGMRKKDFFGSTRMTLLGHVEHMEEKDSLAEPGKKSLHIYFKGEEGRGMIALSPQEVERIVHSVEGQILMKNAEEEILVAPPKGRKKSSRKRKK